MNAEKQATDAQVVADGETAELDASPGDAEERADTFESETPEPDGGAEIAEEPTDAGPFTAPGADVEIEEIRERMRREFQSQKDREIQRERRRWEADLETLNDGGRQGQWDREETAKPKAGQPGYVAHVDALGATFAGLGARLRELPEMADLQDADWDSLLRTGNFERFVKGAVGLAAKRKYDDDLREQAEDQAAAKVKEKLASMRSTEATPDLMPPGIPGTGFDRIEERYVAGEIGIDTYRAAHRRESLQD